MQDDTPTPRRLTQRRLVTLGLAAGATALVAVLAVFNLGPTTAMECPAQPGAAAKIDAVAVGELAALNGTGTGRGYSSLAFEDGDGKPLTLAAFAGKRLLVNLWASWCVPCRAEMPELDALAAKYNSDTFMVLPINLDIGQGGLDKARAFLAEGKWPNLPLYADPTFKVFDRLKTAAVATGLPATLLLDAKGCELAVLPGPASWDSQDGHNVIEALLASG
jgi:thiol-disulfide isomerase/thioredoxin